MKPYDYAHRTGVRPISWDEFAILSARLAELLEHYQPELILGIARAGLFPATLVACSLRCELFPIRLSRRVNDQILYDRPVWRVPVPQEVTGRLVGIIDEIADTGQTLAIVADETRNRGARQVVTASLVSHSWANPAPQICPLISDEFIIFPWDARVLRNGKWVQNPEVMAGLKAQQKSSAG